MKKDKAIKYPAELCSLQLLLGNSADGQSNPTLNICMLPYMALLTQQLLIIHKLILTCPMHKTTV